MASDEGDLKKAFGKLTDDDIAQYEGNQDKLLGILQERYGYDKEQAQAEWDRFAIALQIINWNFLCGNALFSRTSVQRISKSKPEEL